MADWQYVPNPTGGFLGLWWHFKTWNDCTVYLQLEQGNLCLKIAVENSVNQSVRRNQWCARIMEEAKAQGRSEIVKPSRFGKGRYMTAAIVPSKDWLGADDAVLNEEAVVKRLRDYERFLDSCL